MSRRASDIEEGKRTGEGRRARDQLLGDYQTLTPIINQHPQLKNLTLFLVDDLRQSGLAISGIEAVLVETQKRIQRSDLTLEELRLLVEDERIKNKMDQLLDSLTSLRHTMATIYLTFKSI